MQDECNNCDEPFEAREWETLETTSLPSAKWKCPSCGDPLVVVF